MVPLRENEEIQKVLALVPANLQHRVTIIFCGFPQTMRMSRSVKRLEGVMHRLGRCLVKGRTRREDNEDVFEQLRQAMKAFDRAVDQLERRVRAAESGDGLQKAIDELSS